MNISTINNLSDFPKEILFEFLGYLPLVDRLRLMRVNEKFKQIVSEKLLPEEQQFRTTNQKKYCEEKIRGKRIKRYQQAKQQSKKIGKVTVIVTSPITLPTLGILAFTGLQISVIVSLVIGLPFHKNKTCLKIISLPFTIPCKGIDGIIDTIKDVHKNSLKG